MDHHTPERGPGSRKQTGLGSFFFMSLCLITIVFLAGSFATSIFTYYMRYQEEKERIVASHTEVQQELLKMNVDNVAAYVEHTISTSRERLMTTLSERTNEAWDVASHLFRSYGQTMGEAELQKLIIESIRPLRYDNGQGYYFILRMDGMEMLFADRPDMEGRNLLDMQGPDGKHVIRELIDIARESGEGYSSYLWTKPGSEGDHHEKISFIKLFEPYGWIIGTGDYMENVEQDIQQEVLDWLVKVRFGKNGYLFGSRYNGDALFTNGRITQGTGNIWDLTDPNGVRIVQEQVRIAKEQGQGFVSYSWRKLDDDEPTPKLAYVRGVDQWGWVLGSGVYLDEMQSEAESLRLQLRKDLYDDARRTVLALITGVLLSLLAARLISGRLGREMRVFSEFFTNARESGALIDTDHLRIREFRDLARTANAMADQQAQAREALAGSEKRFRSLVEKSPMPMAVLNTRQQLRLVNRKFTEAFGYTLKDLGSPDVDYTRIYPDPKYRAEVLDRWEKAKAKAVRTGGVIEGGECRFTCKDGRVLTLDMVGVTIDDMILVVFTDITSFRRTEERLATSLRELSNTKALLDAVFEQSPIPMIVAEESSRSFLFMNSSSKEILGISDDLLGRSIAVVAGMPWSMYTAMGEKISLRNMALARVFREERIRGEEVRVVRGDGSVRWVAMYGAPIYNDDGDLIAGYITFPDITTRKTTEEFMIQSEKMLSLGSLSAGMAHEINNPLAAIMGAVENARRRTLGDQRRNRKVAEECGISLEQLRCYLEKRDVPNMLRAITEAGARAAAIVRSMLSFSRREGRECTPSDLARLLDDAVLLAANDYDLKKKYDFKQIAIHRYYDQDVGMVSCMPNEIQQVFLNLFKNAAQAMAGQEMGRPALELSITRDESHAIVTISDNGPGMDEATRRRVFEPFFTTKGPGEGTGLGLAVSYFIISRFHNGSIEVRSIQGQGASFIIRLPLG